MNKLRKLACHLTLSLVIVGTFTGTCFSLSIGGYGFEPQIQYTATSKLTIPYRFLTHVISKGGYLTL